MSASDIRVNARLTGEDARRFKELQDRENWSATDVIRETVREYHRKTGKPRKSVYEVFRESGLIGSIKGPPDLSTNTRKYIVEVLDRKKKPRRKRR